MKTHKRTVTAFLLAAALVLMLGCGPLSGLEASSPPTATPTAASENRPPEFPATTEVVTETDLQYDAGQFLTLAGAVTKVTITGAYDPDDDPLTYRWDASNGSITWADNVAEWVREISAGKVSGGELEVTVEDGRGGTATFTIKFP
jgi:hypothetical protein